MSYGWFVLMVIGAVCFISSAITGLVDDKRNEIRRDIIEECKNRGTYVVNEYVQIDCSVRVTDKEDRATR